MDITGESCLGKDIYTIPQYHARAYLLITKGNTLFMMERSGSHSGNKLSISNGGTVNHDVTHDAV